MESHVVSAPDGASLGPWALLSDPNAHAGPNRSWLHLPVGCAPRTIRLRMWKRPARAAAVVRGREVVGSRGSWRADGMEDVGFQ